MLSVEAPHESVTLVEPIFVAVALLGAVGGQHTYLPRTLRYHLSNRRCKEPKLLDRRQKIWQRKWVEVLQGVRPRATE